MRSGKPYILFCAGEDSGDCLGQDLVLAASKYFDVVGAGGNRMVSAGMVPLVDFNQLPVSGFGDVLPRYFKLRQSFLLLKSALENPQCLGLVAIDYPGFNMRLSALADKLKKPVLYVAPPQVWAWKVKRARQIAKMENVRLAVFFDFEKSIYEKYHCDVSLMRHPFVSAVKSSLSERLEVTPQNRLLLLPGSRLSQGLRNLPHFLKVAQRIHDESSIEMAVVTSRESLVPAFERAVIKHFCGEMPNWLNVVVAPRDSAVRAHFYKESSFAITAPGTSTLELALSGCPMVVCTKPDFMTFELGKRFIKTNYFALPNLLLNRREFPEYICRHFADSQLSEIASYVVQQLKIPTQKEKSPSIILRDKLACEKTSYQLMSEFLAQFLKG